MRHHVVRQAICCNAALQEKASPISPSPPLEVSACLEAGGGGGGIKVSDGSWASHLKGVRVTELLDVLCFLVVVQLTEEPGSDLRAGRVRRSQALSRQRKLLALERSIYQCL